MPTQRPRHMVTETDRLAKALDQAEDLWPDSRGQRGVLLRHIIDRGIEAIDDQLASSGQARLGAVEALAGGWSEVWPDNWRDEMRQEWPE